MKKLVKLIIVVLFVTFNVNAQSININNVSLTSNGKDIRLDYLSDDINEERTIIVVKLTEEKIKIDTIIDKIINKKNYNGFLLVNSLNKENYYWSVENGEYLLVVLTKKNNIITTNKKILKINNIKLTN